MSSYFRRLIQQSSLMIQKSASGARAASPRHSLDPPFTRVQEVHEQRVVQPVPTGDRHHAGKPQQLSPTPQAGIPIQERGLGQTAVRASQAGDPIRNPQDRRPPESPPDHAPPRSAETDLTASFEKTGPPTAEHKPPPPETPLETARLHPGRKVARASDVQPMNEKSIAQPGDKNASPEPGDLAAHAAVISAQDEVPEPALENRTGETSLEPAPPQRTWQTTMVQLREWVSETPAAGEIETAPSQRVVAHPVEIVSKQTHPVAPHQEYQVSIGAIHLTVEESPEPKPEPPPPQESDRSKSAPGITDARLRRHYIRF
jgi:hypothetical protein